MNLFAIERYQNQTKSLIKNILGNTDDRTFVKPVFYNKIDTEKLKQLIGGEKLFRIEGLEKVVNYVRIEAGVRI
jgi:hypothetical protein